MNDPAARIRLIEHSLRCFTLGLLSLIPVLGLVPGVLAIRVHFQVWSIEDREWNPAGRYLRAGFCLAWCGLILGLGFLSLGLLTLAHNVG